MAAHASHSSDFPVCPDHHLWRNGRLWWVAFTVHLPPWHKERVRRSLGTDDVHEARRRRDELLRRYPQERNCTLSLRCSAERPVARHGSPAAPQDLGARWNGGRRRPSAWRPAGADMGETEPRGVGTPAAHATPLHA